MGEKLLVLTQLSTENDLLQAASDPGVLQAYVESLLPSLLGFLMNVIVAVLVLLVGSRIIKALVKMVRRFMERSRAEAGVVTFLCSFVKYALYFVLGMIVLGEFGVTTSSVVAVLGSAGLTVGLALQGSLSNFAGGVLILLLKPFVVGDYIVESSTKLEGTVKEITIYYTKLLTVENQLILIPNGTLSNTSVKNITHMEKRCIDLAVGVSYDADLKEAKRVLSETASADPAALEVPVQVFVSELGESAVQLGVRVWVKSGDYWTARWRLLENIKNALDAHGIEIPYPQMEITVNKNGGEQDGDTASGGI